MASEPVLRRRVGRLLAASSVLALFASFVVVSPVLAASPAGASPRSAPDQTVVVRMAGRGSQVSAASVRSLAHGDRVTTAPANRVVIEVPEGQVPSLLTHLRSDPQVSSASVAQAVHATATPNDPCYVTGCVASDDFGDTGVWNQAYLNAIGAPQAWAVTHGNGVRVAVLDSGVYAAHPDLQGKIVGEHNICIDDDPLCGGSGDGLGHGTHVTGILAADTDNGIGVASLGWGVLVDEYKVLDSTGSGNTADVATAIYDAVAAGDRVINMSFANYSCQADPNSCGPDPDEQAAVEYAIAHNVVVVAAAGNDGFDSPTYPASYPGVLSVAATDNSGVVQSFSQWGSAANIAAPGINIISTWNKPTELYHVEDGTSMAAPQVSAAAALMIAHGPRLSGPQIVELLEATARPIAGGHPIAGGMLDVPAALAAEARPPHLFQGYDLVGSDGSVYSFGSVAELGDLSGTRLAKPAVGMTLASNGLGYWLTASDGGVFTFGDAGFYGSTGAVRLAKPVVGMASTPDGGGYWLVASDGGVFSFGDARFYGSTGGVAIPAPVVGLSS
jgi:Subtilase family